jgi:hypothetical protein
MAAGTTAGVSAVAGTVEGAAAATDCQVVGGTVNAGPAGTAADVVTVADVGTIEVAGMAQVVGMAGTGVGSTPGRAGIGESAGTVDGPCVETCGSMRAGWTPAG